ncbi:putative cytochrome P450 hydroxylase [Rhodococcus aetherivorans]|uniref:Cytochrome P450 hydroxylase n=1 Tax=Rhodococcus aetherivorans TaxID=191292 RepID=A0ABQ0YU77_9NOCA|nr:hypothetical protein [Rhodococcus aetherivorans]ETT25532.1 hypothetical protein RR21198_3654 [Rhodococcus rhodochrous ATCC 21198]GES39950.1 putative cytochrome P450 hydroxylase [Rhodococcus aetherivorans]
MQPDQLLLLLRTDFAAPVDGVIRYPSVPYMRRTATVGTELGGARIRAGRRW